MLLLWFVTKAKRNVENVTFFSNMTIDQMYFHFGLRARTIKRNNKAIYIQRWTIAPQARVRIDNTHKPEESRSREMISLGKYKF